MPVLSMLARDHDKQGRQRNNVLEMSRLRADLEPVTAPHAWGQATFVAVADLVSVSDLDRIVGVTEAGSLRPNSPKASWRKGFEPSGDAAVHRPMP